MDACHIVTAAYRILLLHYRSKITVSKYNVLPTPNPIDPLPPPPHTHTHTHTHTHVRTFSHAQAKQQQQVRAAGPRKPRPAELHRGVGGVQPAPPEGQAVHANQAKVPHHSRGKKNKELRVDVTDGQCYPLDSFVEEYGGSLNQPPYVTPGNAWPHVWSLWGVVNNNTPHTSSDLIFLRRSVCTSYSLLGPPPPPSLPPPHPPHAARCNNLHIV